MSDTVTRGVLSSSNRDFRLRLITAKSDKLFGILCLDFRKFDLAEKYLLKVRNMESRLIN